jgi:hypothetical protein
LSQRKGERFRKKCGQLTRTGDVTTLRLTFAFLKVGEIAMLVRRDKPA